MTDLDTRVSIGGAIKALGDNRIGGYLVSFTDETRRDLYGEWFDSETNFMLDDYPVKGYNTLFHHGFDVIIGARSIGKIDEVTVDDKGIWIAARLKENEEYVEWVSELMQSGELGWSSGALPQAVRVADTGHIEQWPIIEASVTHTPAMPVDTRITSLRSFAPVSLRERGNTPAKEVTVSTSGGAVSSIYIEYNGNKSQQDTGENLVDKKQLQAALENSAAVKMLDEEARAEIAEMIETRLSEFVGLMEEKMMDEGQLDEEAARAGEAEMVEEVTEAVAKMEDEDDAAKALDALFSTEKATSFIEAYMRGFNQAIETRRAAQRHIIESAIDNMKTAPATSKKSEAGGVKGNSMGNNNNISVSEDLRFSHLTPEQMALGIKMLAADLPESLRGRVKIGDLVSEDYARHAAHKMAAFMDRGGFKDVSDNIAVRNASPFKSFKADEINASDITAQGAEWLGIFYDNSVWQRVRDEAKLFDLMMSKGMRNQPIPLGNASVRFQTDTSSGTVYLRNEANDLASNDVEITAGISAFGTGNVTVTGKEHVIANVVTDRLQEQSIINAVQWADQDMLTTLAEALEDAMINGDTTSDTTNINHDGAALQTAPNIELWRAWNGIRHHFLIDNTTLRSDHATGALAAATFLNTRNLLPGAVRNKRANGLFVIDYGTEAKARQVAELFTRDVAYGDATFFTGVLPPIDGVEVYTSGFLRSADTDGKVTDGGNGTNTGTLMYVHAPYWAYANQRQINIETARGFRGALSGSTLLVATVVHGFSARSVNAASGTFNISIA